jgi:alpha-1,6-mannosyltransferase
MLFAVVGIATALVYFLWVTWIPLLPDNLHRPLLDLGKITGYTWPSALRYLSLVASQYLLYVIGYRLVARGAGSALVFLFGGTFCLELIAAYPATAVDVFGYIAHGRLIAEHHANPFVVAADAYESDAILPYLAFPHEPSQYGPIWVVLGHGLATLARGDLLIEIVLYKVVGALAHVAGAALVLAVARKLGAGECQARASAYLFLWNPLLLWEMVGNAHNDGVMMLGGLLAAWLLLARVDLLVLPAVALGALVKLPIVVTVPLLFMVVWRRKRAAAIGGFGLAMLLVLVVYRPFWEGFDTLTALRRTHLFTASFGSVLRLSLAPSLGLSNASTLARWTSLGAFGVVVLVSLSMVRRARSVRDVLGLVYATLLAAVLFATTWFQAWYVVWPFAFGAALANSRRHLEMALLSLGGLLQYLVFIYLWVMGVFPRSENLEVQGAAYLAVVGPLLLGLACLARPRYGRGNH